MLIPHQRKLNRSRMIALLEEMGRNSEPGRSLYLPAGWKEPETTKAISAIFTDTSITPELIQTLSKPKTGGILLWGHSHRYLILPPFPLTESLILDSYHVAPLLSQLQKNRTIGLILLRLGESAVGVFEGERRISSKVGTGLVHARHRQGGSSSQRFERHRQKQMEMFFTRVCSHAREHFEPYVKQMDYAVYGGEKKTLQLFRKQCDFLRVFDDRVLPRTLDVRKPRQATLEESISEVWSSTLIEWIEG